MLDELRSIKSADPQLREFGATMAAALAVIGDVALLRGRPFAPWLIGASVFFLVSGLRWPRVLLPLQKAWMGFGVAAGLFTSRAALFILYFGVLTPVGLLMRLSGKDILDERADTEKASYWHVRPPQSRPKDSYENRY